VIMIEHDMRAVTQADQVIDIGPGAGHEEDAWLPQELPNRYRRSKKAVPHSILPGNSHGTVKRAVSSLRQWRHIPGVFCISNLPQV
jgi:excinuclease UvrABC ATPase subunit